MLCGCFSMERLKVGSVWIALLATQTTMISCRLSVMGLVEAPYQSPPF